MPHTPWPENGCTLAEARERTADPMRWKKWRDERRDQGSPATSERAYDNTRTAPLKPAAAYEEMINADFLLQFRALRLIAYGRHRDVDAPPQFINLNIWLTLTVIDWEESTAGEERRGSSKFYDVRVYPALLAPCRVDLVAGLSPATVFQKFVMEDPEFVALARHAVKFDKAVHPMLQEGQFARRWSFSSQWPIDLTPFPGFADVINDAHSFGERVSVTSDKSRKACEVLRDRYMRLLSLVKSGSVVARGTYVLSGRVEEIDVAQWSRPSGWIDTRSGDLLEEIDNKLVARWTGLTFSAPRKSTASGRSRMMKRAVRPRSRKSAASTGNRRRPKGDAVAKALRRIGRYSSPGPYAWKELASKIAPHMPDPPVTALQWEALSKAVKRHYVRR